MEINLKTFIVALMYEGYTYRELMDFFKYLLKRELINEKMTPYEWGQLALTQLRNFNASHLNAIEHQLENPGFQQVVTQCFMIGERVYPQLWLEIPQPPLIMFYQGDLSCLTLPMVTVIGTRNITDYGKKMTHQLTTALVNSGYAIVSGLALGVDQWAHQAAIQANGRTIGIIASGFETSYPKKNASLQTAIGRHHLLLSEYLPHIGIRKHHFIMRNRLVAGLTPLTIIIEASQRSGSLYTANFAIQSNRELLVLPGRITDPQSRGCHDLIELGATPILSPEQMIQTVDEVTAHFYP